MKIAVEFPSVIYREGPSAVKALMQAIERIGFDGLDMLDHVVMPHPRPGAPASPYAATMPILEALTALAFAAAATSRITLGTKVLVLPQRQTVLAAKQMSTISTLSGGRLRIGVGAGWQQAEFAALGAEFQTRGRRMVAATKLLRSCWRETSICMPAAGHESLQVAMEPKPPNGGPPIWLGGHSETALRRAGRYGDGWMAMALPDAPQGLLRVRHYAELAGRDPQSLGYQVALSTPPRQGTTESRDFFANPPAVAAAAARAVEQGFDWISISATSVFLAGARRGDQLAEALDNLHELMRREVGGSTR